MRKLIETDRPIARALRRHHRSRMIARALRSEKFAGMSEAERIRWALRQFDHLKSCSCWMCGNSRKFRGEPTLQEMRHLKAIRLDGIEIR